MNLKTHLLSISIFAASVLTATADMPGSFNISGHVTNVPDSSIIILLKGSANLLMPVSTATIVGGEFHFRDTISGPASEYFLLGQSRGFPGRISPVWIEPGAEISISGDGMLLPLWNITSSVPLQASVAAIDKAAMPELAESVRLSAEETEIIRHLNDTPKGEEVNSTIAWAQIDSIRERQDSLQEIIDSRQLTYLASAPIDRVWLGEFSSYASRVYREPDYKFREQVMSIYARLTDEQLETDLGKSIKGYLTMNRPLKVGDKMADATLFDKDGKPHNLSEFAGRHILLDFWSLGCGPCIASMPEAEEAATEYGDNLAFISISRDDEKPWRKYISGKNGKVIHWNEQSNGQPGITDRYGAFSIPCYVLISPSGVISAKWVGYSQGSLLQTLSEHLR